MKQYLMVTRNTIISSLTYRAHFIFQILASSLAIVVQFFLWQAVFASSNQASIQGMNFQDTFVYVSLATALNVLMRTWTEWYVSSQILSGDIVMYLFKPIEHMHWTFFESLGGVIGNFITITLPSLIVIFLVFGAKIAVGFNLVIFVPALFLSWVLNFLFDYTIGLTCFWTMSIWGISATKDALIVFLSGALIPLPFYPEQLRQLLYWLPFAWMYHFPLSVINAKSPDWLYWLKGLGVQIFWVAFMYLLVRAYRSVATKKLTVNGG